MDHEQKHLYLQAKKNRFIFGGMSKKSTAPSLPLTKDEWEAMTKRRKDEMKKPKNNPSGFIEQPDPEYRKMVEAFLGGAKTWKKWQDSYGKKPSIKIYDFKFLDFFHELKLNRATFNKTVGFVGTTFNKGVNFENATFTEDAYFLGATFTKQAHFWQTTFTKKAYFLGAIFTEYANFWQATFQKSGSFHDAKFYGNEIHFSEMVLSADSHLIFTGTEFYNAVPDFRHLNRSPDIRFNNFDVIKPSLLLTQKQFKKMQKILLKKKYSLPRAERQDAFRKLKFCRKRKWKHVNEDRYRKLKELAIGNHNHEYELIFYGYEMDSKLINFYKSIKKMFSNKKWWGDILPTHFYKFFSNYGQSIGRPMLVLLILLIVPWVYYSITDNGLLWLNFALSKNDNLLSLIFALPNPEPDILFETIKPIMPFPFFIFAVNSLGHFGVKIIASVFWFLLFLAVRNKFKIK